MSAMETFEQFSRFLPAREKEAIKDLVKLRKAELFAARSEDARVRLVQSYIEEINELLAARK